MALPKIRNFGEFVLFSYANMQMAFVSYSRFNKKIYDADCYKIRAKAFKAYKDGIWQIHDLLKINISKMKNNNNFCWYCLEEFDDFSELTIDHIFPRSKGGTNEVDNILLVCKHCNSSKRDMDLLEWYFTKREIFPPIYILTHYLKNIYSYAKTHGLLEKHREELLAMKLPFNIQYIPIEYPQPIYWVNEDYTLEKEELLQLVKKSQINF
ncbi:MAG: HNH endonuclease [Paludibacteraceae bacterium]|nr:HNH endonuclease [Paludibacteraceae bacterium]MEE0911670.1 HNH endonuclease [Paludibacteraceae bacterium]